MRIRTQFIVASLIFAAILAVLGFSILFGGLAIQTAVAQGRNAVSIDTEISELDYLTNDYLLYHEPQLLARWQSKYADLESGLAVLTSEIAGERAIIETLQASLADTKSVFDEARATLEALPAGQSADPAFIQLYWSRLEIQNQGMHFDTTRLVQLLSERERELRNMLTVLVIILTALFGIFLFSNYFFNYRRIIRSLERLQAGAAVIGSGNLDFHVTNGTKDEVGAVANAFNRMTADLKRVTASKSDLEREVEERKRAEIELQRSELRYRTVADNTYDFEFWLDPQGKYLYASPACVRIYGYTADEFAADPALRRNLIVPEDIEKYDRHIAAESGRTASELEFRIRRKDGQIIWLSHVCQPVFDAAGNYLGVRGSNRDITTRKHAEQALKDSEERFRGIVETAEEGIATHNPDGTITYVNQRMADMLGYPPEEIVGRSSLDFVGEDEKESVIKAREKIRESGSFTSERRMQRKDGSILWTLSHISPRRDSAGNFVGYLAMHTEITTRKRAEDALADSEERLARSQEIAHLGSWELDLMQDRLIWSDETYRIFGLKPQEFEATYEAFLERIPPEDRSMVDRAYAESVRSGASGYDIEHRIVRAHSGEIRYVHEKCRHFRDASGKIVRSIGMVHDITERKRAEAEMAHLASFPALNPNPVVELGAAGDLVYYNPAAREQCPGLESQGAAHPFFKGWEQLFYDLRHGAPETSREINIGERWHWQTIAYVPVTDTLRFYSREVTKRREAERALASSEARYRELFSSMSEGFALHEIILDKAGKPCDYRFLELNPAFERLTGLKASGVIGKTVREVLPATEEFWIQNYGRVALSGEPMTFSDLHGWLGKWYEVFAYSPRRGQFAVIFTDITERKRAETNRDLLANVTNALNPSNDLHAFAAETLRQVRQATGFDAAAIRLKQGEDAPYFETSGFSEDFVTKENYLCAHDGKGAIKRGADGRIILECTCGLVLSGQTPSDMDGFTPGGSFWTNKFNDLLSLLPGDDPRHNPRNHCIHTGYQSVGLFPIRSGDNILGLLQLNDISEGMFTPENVSFYESLAANIGLSVQKVSAEQALADSEERLRLHAENSPLAVIEWDANFVVTRWAGAAEEMFGYSAADAIGKPIMDLRLIYQPDIPMVERTMSHLTDGVTRTYTSTNRNVTRDGRVIWCTWYNSVLYDQNGRMRSVMSEVQDITEARRLDRAKDEFISMVSHEIRNPLTVVLGSVQTALTPGISDEDVRLMMQNAAEGALSMERIISNLLELSRAQADRLKLEREKIDVANLAEKIIGQVKMLYPFHGYKVASGKDVPRVSADAVRVERILFNLVENAAKYSPQNTPIEVKLKRTGAEVTVAVSDKGMGIPQSRIGELFEPFQRLVEHSTHAKGLGLGLVVCKRLVEAHGGKIWVESKEGCGTTFYFTLPVG